MNLRSSREMDPMVFLILLLLLGPSHSQAPCKISKMDNKVETNCESLGLKSVPLKIPPDTAILRFENNSLKSFSTSSLSHLTQITELNLAKNNISELVADGKLALLSILDLSDNDLQTLPPLGHIFPSLTLLDLSRNALESLPSTALTGLRSLENLYLRGNKLRSLPSNLKTTSSLQKLDLANNNLEHLPKDLLADLSNLNTLFLQNNLLSVLPDNFFQDHILAYVFLHSNPWNCNCKLRYFRDWLQDNQGNVYLWQEGVDVKVMTPDVNSVQCKVPFSTPVYNFSMNCFNRGDGINDITTSGVLESKTTTIPKTTSLEHSTVHSKSKMTTTETTIGSTTLLSIPETTRISTMPKFTRFLISEVTTHQITPETTTFPTIRRPTIIVNRPETNFPTTRRAPIFLNISEISMFPTISVFNQITTTSESTTLHITSESTPISETLEITKFSNSLEPTTFPATSETTMLQNTPKLVPFSTTNSTVHTSVPVTSPNLSSTLTLQTSHNFPPNEAVTLGSSSEPRLYSPISIPCCLLSLGFYILGIGWVLVSSIVLILFLALCQHPPHLLRTHTFMEDIPNPRATVHVKLTKEKEVIFHRAWLLFLEGSLPSFRTRLFLWVRSNGRVRPLTLKRKPSAMSLGRGEDLLGAVSIRYSDHSL